MTEKKTPRLRWSICALLFFATTINYIDRQVFSILAPDLQKSIGWNEIEYGYIVTAFQAAYAIGLVLVGRLMDKIGTRRGFALIISVWSIAAMVHAWARSALTFGIARFALGLSEAGNFPASIKTVAEWFPKQERALATGFFNAGSNVGAIVAPLIVPWIAVQYGWRAAFLVTGAIGFLWLLFWLGWYRHPDKHSRISPRELAHIQSDPAESSESIAWARLVPLRQTWAITMGKVLSDPVWWFYLFWLPKFLNQNYGLSLDRIGPPLVAVYLMADVGSIAGGWGSSALIKHGWSVNAARKTTMLICALSVVPIMFMSMVSNLWVAVALLGLATAAHQGWSANLYTLVSDMFPQRAVASVVGFAGMGGAISGMFVSTAAGFILEWTGSYMSLFILAGSMYLIALGVIHLLVPRLESPNL
jgi:ACS family hexuronate transporter-like MFS transporter